MGNVGILKGCKFEHTELSIQFKSISDDCAIITFSLSLIKFPTMNFPEHTKSWSDYDMQ